MFYKQLWITSPAIDSSQRSEEELDKFKQINSEGPDKDDTRNKTNNNSTKGEGDNESTSDMKTLVIESLDVEPVRIERCNCSISPLNALCLEKVFFI